MARGVDGMSIYVDDADRIAFLNDMRRIERECSLRIIAYCLMGNHFHFAIQVGHIPLAVAMQRLLTPHCMRFNRRHDRTGHLFQGRHKAVICLDDRYLSNLIRYIHMNPVRAGLVAAAKDWPWSSYDHAADAGEVDADFDPWPKGTQEIDLMRKWENAAVALDVVGSTVTERTGIGLDVLRSESRIRTVVEARRVFVQEAIACGHRLKFAAQWLHVSERSASRYALEKYCPVGGPGTKIGQYLD